MGTSVQKTNHYIRLTIHEAKLDKDTNLFLTMDPYFKIKYGDQKHESDKHYGGGKEPKWNGQLQDFKIYFKEDEAPSGEIEINFYNDGDKICGAFFLVKNLINATDGERLWFDTGRKGKESGQFMMSCEYTGQFRNEEKPEKQVEPQSIPE